MYELPEASFSSLIQLAVHSRISKIAEVMKMFGSVDNPRYVLSGVSALERKKKNGEKRSDGVNGVGSYRKQRRIYRNKSAIVSPRENDRL